MRVFFVVLIIWLS